MPCNISAFVFDHLLAVLAGLVFITVVPVLAIKVYATLTCGYCTSKKNMKGKTVIVTGANSGIGKETAKDLARRGAKVILACRNLETAKTAKDEIIAATNNDNVLVCHLDLSSQASIRKFAAEINKNESRLDVLVHNAGVANVFGRVTTGDGLELTMATNHYGPFLLTHLLIDLLKKTKPSRIVIVASELYRLACLNLNNPNPVSTFPAYLYYVSKYANIVFTKELARKLEGTGVTANCLHPGLIDSGIWRNVPFPMSLLVKGLARALAKTAEQGCQTTVHLAVSEELEGVTGKYYLDCKDAAVSRGADDPAVAKKFWEISEGLALKPSDPRL